MSKSIPCFLCGTAHPPDQMASSFSFPEGTPKLLSMAVRSPMSGGEFVYQQVSEVGVCSACQRAVLVVRRAAGI